ncbi:MAG TPA: energy transducer TonB [Gammaproteobacteria bacterium]|nr:energy transducer TonB [Gammaproteobacteria bacterium]
MVKNHITGFTVSTVFHLSIAMVFLSTSIKIPVPVAPQATTLKLSVFKTSAPKMPKATPQTVQPQPVARQAPVKKPQLKPTPKHQKKVHQKKKHPSVKPVKTKTTEVEEIITEPVQATPQPTPRQPAPIKAAPPPVASAPPVTAPASIDPQYKAQLQAAIERNKNYPRRAQRQRQQGTVVVSFTVLRNGDIERLHVLESSGYPRLDKAALKAVGTIAGKFPLPDSLMAPSWNFKIPIRYRL